MKIYRYQRFFVASLTVALLLLFIFFYKSDSAASKSGSLLAPSLTATKTAILDATNAPSAGDLNGNGLVNPGDRMLYTITIPNAGADPALNVTLSDTIGANTTLLSSSVVASPIAVNDAYTSIGNVGITVPDGSSDLLGNDLDANNPGVNTALGFTKINNSAFSSGTSVSTANGMVTVNANGSFSYMPNPGFEGTDTFSYTLGNNTGLTDTATVTITVSEVVWFVNAASATNGSGTLNSPFNCFVGANCFSSTTADDADDVIFLYSGNYTGGQTLLTNQKLIGQGASGSIASIANINLSNYPFSNALPATNSTPANVAVTNTVAAASAITLGTGNTVRGLTIGNTTAAKISGSGFGTLTLGNNTTPDVVLNGTGQALNLTNGTFAASSALSSLTTTGSTAQGVSLTTVAGTIAFGSTTVSGSTTQGISLMTSTASINFGNTTIGTASAGTGGTDGVSLQNNTSGTRTFGTLSIQNNSAVGFLHSNGGGLTNITGATTITNPGGRGIDIQNTTVSNGVTFSNVNDTQSGSTGVFLNANAGATTFADLDISPDAGQRAFQATNNTGTITTTSGTISNSSAVAVEITNASGTVPLNMQLTSVSANSGASGIILTNTSATGSPGGFRVLGNSSGQCGGNVNTATDPYTVTAPATADCTGGTIQNTSGNGIQLSNSAKVSLARMWIKSTTGSGIKGSNNVTDFTFQNGFIDASNDDGTNTVNESNIGFNNFTGGADKNITGTITITNSTLTNALYHGVHIQQYDGTISDVNISNNVITSSTSGAASLGSGVILVSPGTASTVANVTKAAISNNVVRNFPSGAGIVFQGGNANSTGAPAGTYGVPGNAANIINITGNRIKGSSAANQIGIYAIQASVNGRGQGNFNISNNGSVAEPITNVAGNVISHSAFGFANVTTTISNNVIVANHTAGVGGALGISVGVGRTFAVTDAATLTVSIAGNRVSQTDANGILARAVEGQSTMNISVKNNTVAAPLSGVRPGIRIDSGSSEAGINATVCLDMQNNTSSGSGGTQGLGLRKQGTATATNFFGVEGMVATGTPGVESYVNGLNPAGNGTLLISGTSGFSGCSSAPNFAAAKQSVEEKSGDSVNKLKFFDVSYQSSSEILASGQPFFVHSAKLETNKQEENPKTDTLVEAVEIPESKTASRPASSGSNFLREISSAIVKLMGDFNSLVSPTAQAQGSEKAGTPNAPASGETINKSLGTLPAGEQIVVQFKATINSSIPANVFSVSNQATISGSNFSNILTDGDVVTPGTQPTVTTVVQPPAITKAFGATNIAVNGVMSLTFTISNGNVGQAYTQLAFSDTLPAGLVINTPNNLTNTCNGSATATQNTSVIALSGGTLAAPVSAGTTTTCTLKVDVKGTAEGVKNNVSGAISSLQGGTGNTASATLNVIAAPSFTKAFGAATVQLNNSVSLLFTVTNNSAVLPLSNVSFTDTLPAGLVVANPNNQTGMCGGSITATAGSGAVSLSGATLAANSNCTFSVNVTGTSVGVKNNTATLSTAELGAGATATASITVIAPPTIAKVFAPTSITEGGTSNVTLTLSNPNTTAALTNASFTDTLSNMSAVGGAVSGSCAGTSSNTLSTGATNISFSGITIPNNGSCTISFAVKSNSVGTNPNTTSGVATLQTPVAGTPSNTADLTVIAAADLAITKTHTGNFTQGDTGKTYTITVTNSGGTPTSETVTVTDTLPTGLTATAISGTGWNCSLGTLSCTRSDVLNNGSSYPAITLTVNVANNAPASITNTATASGGGELNTANNTANDATTINPAATYTISGQVTNGGAALSGVNVALSGTSTTSTVTDAAGNYSFSNLASGGNFTVTPSLNGYTFNPSSTSVNNIIGNQTTVNFASSTVAYEADAAPRPAGDGDGTVNGGDITVIRKFVAGIEIPVSPAAGSEFQRVDSAPLYDANNNLVKGDGAVNAGDITQVRRFAAGLDAIVPAGGPVVAIPPPVNNPLNSTGDLSDAFASPSQIAAARDLRPVKVSLVGNVLTVAVNLNTDPADTAANTVGFTLQYDAAVLSNPTNVRLGSNAPATTTVTSNTMQSGKVGVLLDLPVVGATTTFPLGDAQLVLIDFTVVAMPPATTSINFGDTPVARFVGDINGNRLTTTFSSGSIALLAPTAAAVTLSGRVMSENGRGINNVIVEKIDSQGQMRTAKTNPFGYYRFYNVPAGEIYILTAKAKGYEFTQPTIVLQVNEDLDELNFTALPAVKFNQKEIY
jgi:uncharacterized repeat protein (TIGR01451 family)